MTEGKVFELEVYSLGDIVKRYEEGTPMLDEVDFAELREGLDEIEDYARAGRYFDAVTSAMALRMQVGQEYVAWTVKSAREDGLTVPEGPWLLAGLADYSNDPERPRPTSPYDALGIARRALEAGRLPTLHLALGDAASWFTLFAPEFTGDADDDHPE